jgi:transposase
MLGTVVPTGAAGVTRHQIATDLIGDVRGLDRRIAAVEARIKMAVAQSKTTVVELFGVGPVLAAKLLGEVGDIGRFPSKHHFAAHTGTAPLEASSGHAVRHRLSRAGDRKLNHALYMRRWCRSAIPPAGRRITAQAHRGQVAQGSPAVSEAAIVGRGLPLLACRSRRPAVSGGPDRLRSCRPARMTRIGG